MAMGGAGGSGGGAGSVNLLLTQLWSLKEKALRVLLQSIGGGGGQGGSITGNASASAGTADASFELGLMLPLQAMAVQAVRPRMSPHVFPARSPHLARSPLASLPNPLEGVVLVAR